MGWDDVICLLDGVNDAGGAADCGGVLHRLSPALAGVARKLGLARRWRNRGGPIARCRDLGGAHSVGGVACPDLSSPQHLIAPLSRIAQLCASPALTAL